ncbi:hypothetical protein [Clostridium botulinum]|nr:hypothetical protein [Clostridium botulinum]MBY6755542.1 hypothetical protein [Clostridium botulinum]MBY6766469.1 hypothetical protein [Clostridium botulinum]MBY6900460.1 hypothetical protein [Clostridium botulinum]MBY6914767.1 hypothetical protein [Clostridium botulinum]
MSVQIRLENQYHKDIMRELKNEEEIWWENIRHERETKNINKREEELEKE